MGETKDVRLKAGSIGTGTNALVTIITVEKESDKLVEETFRMPYLLIDNDVLSQFLKANLIRGFRVEKIDEGKACNACGEGGCE